MTIMQKRQDMCIKYFDKIDKVPKNIRSPKKKCKGFKMVDAPIMV